MNFRLPVLLAGLLTGAGTSWLIPGELKNAPSGEEMSQRIESSFIAGPGITDAVQEVKAKTLAELRALVVPLDEDASRARLYRAVEALPPEMILTLTREALELPGNSLETRLTGRVLHDRLERMDPLEALRLAIQSNHFHPSGMERLAERDPEAAELMLAEVSDLQTERRSGLWEDLLKGLARRDPLAALERAKRGRPEGLKDDEWRDSREDFSTILTQWAKRDPAAALAHYDAIKMNHSELLNKLLKELTVRDPVSALSRRVNEPVESNLNDGIWILKDWEYIGIVMAAHQKDPAAARAVMERSEHNATVQKAHFAEVLARQDWKSAHEYLKTFTEDEARSIIPSIAAGMAATDPAAAALWYLKHTDGGTHGGGEFLEMARRYAVQDPAAALEWALRLRNEDRDLGVAQVLAARGETDIPEMKAALQRIPEDEFREKVTEILINQMIETAPKKVLEWALTLEPERQAEMLGSLGRRSGGPGVEMENRMRAAVTELMKLPEGAVHSGKLADPVYLLALRRGGTEAADWLATLPEGKIRAEVLQNHFSDWANDDSMAVSKWLVTQPSGEARDLGAAELASAIGKDDPAAALSWAAEITQPELRAQRLEETVKVWARKDPAAARNALESVPLDPAARAKLLPLLEP